MASTTRPRKTQGATPPSQARDVARTPQSRLTKSRAIAEIKVCELSPTHSLAGSPHDESQRCARNPETHFQCGVFMRRLLALLVAGTLLTSISVVAQETVRIGEIDAVRVVIAPPQTELARIVKAGLLENYRSADPDSRAYSEAQKLYFFYGARHFEPIWMTEGTGGAPAFSANALKLMDVFEASAAE